MVLARVKINSLPLLFGHDLVSDAQIRLLRLRLRHKRLLPFSGPLLAMKPWVPRIERLTRCRARSKIDLPALFQYMEVDDGNDRELAPNMVH